MKLLKKTVLIGLVVLAVSVAGAAVLADSGYATPAEAAAGITGRTLESIMKEKAETGKTYGAVAAEAGKLDEFKAEILEMRKDMLDAKVAEGVISQEKADEILAALKERIANCDGTGNGQKDRAMGGGLGVFGKGPGKGLGKRSGSADEDSGIGMGNGQGKGFGGAGDGKGQGKGFGGAGDGKGFGGANRGSGICAAGKSGV